MTLAGLNGTALVSLKSRESDAVNAPWPRLRPRSRLWRLSDQTHYGQNLNTLSRRIAELEQQVNEAKDNFQQSNATVIPDAAADRRGDRRAEED